MTSQERHAARYARRKAERERRKTERSESVGTIEDIFTFSALFMAGKRCCRGVRWKQSTQNFETHLLSRTARTRRALLDGTWKPRAYRSFVLFERGKRRPIDAPYIDDRQVHKVLTNAVLWKLYTPSMIYNDGASIKGKGLAFAERTLKEDMRRHMRRYGATGYVLLLDFKAFFPSASHEAVMRKHDELIRDARLKALMNEAEKLAPNGKGLPLGVELSQAEMVALPSHADNFVRCQLGLRIGRYMDDCYILVPPDLDPKAIMRLVRDKATAYGFEVNEAKARLRYATSPFKFCKTKYRLTESGKVVTHGDRHCLIRARRKLKHFARTGASRKTRRDSVQSVYAYYEKRDDHARVLRLNRICAATGGSIWST